jgi:hypothetical protein
MFKFKHDLCVWVKKKPCVELTVIMRLISWIHSRGSETLFLRSMPIGLHDLENRYCNQIKVFENCSELKVT